MILEDRVAAFQELSKFLSNPHSQSSFSSIVKKARQNNFWFTEKNIVFACFALSHMLDALTLWVSSYNIVGKKKKIGVIVASNIPLVGFYDFLCVLISGNIFIGKLSSSNNILLPYVADLLCSINSDFHNYIYFKNDIKNVDILIATGDDNTAHYFNYVYSGVSKIIRKNRTSVAILNGSEKDDDYRSLAKDVYLYFGLGCRNISKLFLPVNFDVNALKISFLKNEFLSFSDAYLDNYSYQKTILQINGIHFFDFENLLLVHSDKIHAPISVVYYEYYDNLTQLQKKIKYYQDEIQCIVAQDILGDNLVRFGESQSPSLHDYPDGVDVLKFLLTN